MQVYDIPIDERRRETTAHGTAGFPVAVYHTVLSRNVLGYVNWHWHEELQLCLVTDGRVEFSVGRDRFELGPGQGIFVNAGFLHRARPAGVAGAGGGEKNGGAGVAADCGASDVARPDGTYVCVDFAPRILRFFDGSLLERRFVTPWLEDSALSCAVLDGSLGWHAEMLGEVRAIHELWERAPFAAEYEVVLRLARCWLFLVRGTTPPAGASAGVRRQHENARLQAILDVIERRYAERLSVAEVARCAALSTSECCRFFKRMTGETIFSCLQKVRVTRAAELLRDRARDLSVSDVAYACGFSSASHFIEVFRRQMGETPLRYRKRSASA